VLRAGTGRNGAAIRRHYAPRGNTESLGTVAIAISTDLTMAVAKAAAAALTGSAALFAETLHSLADTGNQLLLLTLDVRTSLTDRGHLRCPRGPPGSSRPR
jgi:hypothetical protein